MRRIEVEEWLLVALGAVLVVAGVWLVGVPPEVHPLWLAKGWVVKGLLAAAGLAALAAALHSLRAPASRLRTARARERLAKLALLGVGGLVGLATAEVAARIVLPAGGGELPWVERHEVLHHVQVPGWEGRFTTGEWDVAVRINREGMRDEELLPAAAGRERILVLGDSFAWGYGVEAEASFPELLEERLRAAGREAEVLNAAVVSYSPILELLYLRERGLALEPDLVIVAFDMSDFQDDLGYEQAAVRDAAGRVVAVRPAPERSRLRRLYKGLAVVGLLRGFLDGLYAEWRSGEELTLPQTRELEHNRFALTRDDLAPEQAEPHWRRSLGYLAELAGVARARGVPVLLLTYPYGHQVAPGEWRRGRHHYGFAADKLYPDAPARRLEAFAAAEQIPFVSAFAALRAAAGGEPLYFPFDGHFTRRGNQVVAELLAGRLAAADLAPAAAAAQPAAAGSIASSAAGFSIEERSPTSSPR